MTDSDLLDSLVLQRPKPQGSALSAIASILTYVS